MTAIAGFTENGRVYIGADSAGVAGFQTHVRTDAKVFKNGEMLMGFTTSFRMGQILRHHLSLPTPLEGEENYAYMVKQFIPAVKEVLASHGFERSINGRDEGGTFLAGYRGGLYLIDSDFQVGTVENPYQAIGCGDDLVLGAFYALSFYEMTPEERITTALEAAAEFSAGVRGPFTVLSI